MDKIHDSAKTIVHLTLRLAQQYSHQATGFCRSTGASPDAHRPPQLLSFGGGFLKTLSSKLQSRADELRKAKIQKTLK